MFQRKDRFYRERFTLQMIRIHITARISRPKLFCEKVVPKNFAKFIEKHLCRNFIQACKFIEKEKPARVFSCEFCETFNNTFFCRKYPVAAFILLRQQKKADIAHVA